MLDDRSRLCCHLQWYLSEGAEELCHGLTQALLKRSVPRSLLTDNGSAMLATETTQGLARLGMVHETTLPFSPHQNGKQENFWTQIEGRLLPMIEGVADLSLRQLNEATQAWVELEYNRKLHSELGQSPLVAYQKGPDIGRRRAARMTPLAAAPIAPVGLAPLLEKLIARYAATGLPPAYLPKDEQGDHR